MPRDVWIEGRIGTGGGGDCGRGETGCDIILANEIANASADRMGVGEGECRADGRAV